MSRHRDPYVGEGIEGCLRSAAIDLAEADTHATGTDAWYRCRASAHAWEQQADDLRKGAGPTPAERAVIDAALRWCAGVPESLPVSINRDLLALVDAARALASERKQEARS